MLHAAFCRLRRIAGGSHRATVLAIAALIPVLVTCDSSPTEPEDPTSVEAQAKNLFPSGSTRTSAVAQIAEIREHVNRGEVAQARAKVLELVDYMMTAFRAGNLAGGTSEAAGNAASNLIDDLFTLAGMTPPNLPDGALSDDGAAKVVGPQGGLVVTPSGAAGVDIPAGALDQSVLVTVTRLPAPPAPGAGPLPTALKQYGPYYDFSTYPHVPQFGSAMRVGICQVTDPSSPFYPPEPHERLRLAHTVGVGIEILDRVGVNDFLRCTNVTASVAPLHGWRGSLSSLAERVIERVAPAAAYAAHGGLGGKVKSFSPFGAVDPAVSTVTVTLATPMVAGNTSLATAVLKDADGNVLIDRVITWTSSNEALATVSSTGLVTGVAEGGPVTITATSEGKSGSSPLTVTPAPVALVTVSPLSPTVNTGETVQLVATTKDSHGNVLTGRPITWTSSDNSLATVSSSGLVSGILEGGPVTITATSEGQNGTSSVTVTPAPVALVTVSPSPATIVAGEALELAATVLDSHGNTLIGRDVSWTSSNNGIATVSSDGVVTGLVDGDVTITATSEGKSGTGEVTVTAAPVAFVTVNPSGVSLRVGETLQLTATTTDARERVLSGRAVNWTSSNDSWATVSSSGLVTGVAENHQVTISATSEGQTGVALIVVNPALVASLTVSPSSPTVNVGDTLRLVATIKDKNGNELTNRDVSWMSSNNGLATVSSSGLVRGIVDGQVTITANSEGQSGSAEVTVNLAPVATVTVTPSLTSVFVGATQQLTATTKDANGNVLTGRVVTWTSSNNSRATVSSSGLVAGVAVSGSVTVTATSEGKTGTSSVSVILAPVATVLVNPPAPSVTTGGLVQLAATIRDANGNVLTGRVITWTSSNTTLATVSATGLVTTLVAGGPVTITALSEGKIGTAVVTVVHTLYAPNRALGPLLSSIAVGESHGCGLDASGNAYCWGANGSGELGDGTTTPHSTPAAVTMPSGVTFTAITAGGGFAGGAARTCALSTAGVAYCWGNRAGDGSNTARLVPTQVSMPVGITFTSIHTGAFATCALTSAGAAYCWGILVTNTLVPTAITMPLGVAFSQVYVGYFQACAVGTNGSGYCWGGNNNGQLGDGTMVDKPNPVAVSMPSGVTFTKIAATWLNTCALSSGGVAYCWGLNQAGLLGDNNVTPQRSIPGPVLMPSGVTFTAISASNIHTCALSTTGVSYCWGGNNSLGQLSTGNGGIGDGTTINRPIPTSALMPPGVSFQSLSVGISFTCALTSGGVRFCWGANGVGQRGDGTTTP